MSCEPFVDLTRRPEASCLDLQLSIAGELGRADAVSVHAVLDDLARPLFDVAGSDLQARANALLGVMARDQGFGADEIGDHDDLLLPTVLQTRRGHPLMIAIIGCEVARRAGFASGVYSSRTRWFIGLEQSGRLLMLDAGLRDGSGRPAQVIAHCRHELAYCTLTGLSRSFADRGRLQSAVRATRLKLALPLGEQLQAQVRRDLDALLRRPPRS